MKEKVNQMFKDKLFLVMLVLGLLTIVAAAGVATMQRGNGQEQNPYLDMQGQDGIVAENSADQTPVAGDSNLQMADLQDTEEVQQQENPDTVIAEAVYDAPSETIAAEVTEEMINAQEEVREAGSGSLAAKALVLNFTDASKMGWPVRGNIVLDYSMDSTIYFPTLDQYKCNPGLVIQGQEGDPVYAPSNARVVEAGTNEEVGNYLVLDLGNDYSITCGQLKDVTAVQGEYLEKGQLMGYVAAPTKYYSIEGSNLFLEMRAGEKTVDPLDYME